jgi:hypothetical protein
MLLRTLTTRLALVCPLLGIGVLPPSGAKRKADCAKLARVFETLHVSRLDFQGEL